METLRAGAAAVDISPKDSQFLAGYPHVERYSTGIHDPLLSCALYLANDQSQMMFISNDIVHFSKAMSGRVRAKIAAETGMPASHIMTTASHTHSGPITRRHRVSIEKEIVIPDADLAYLRLMEEGMIAAGMEAYRNAQPAQVGLAVADGTGVGTNRHDPSGPADPQVPVLMVKTADGQKDIACMVVYSMHPTVLHEDSTLVSADFPGLARQFLQQNLLGDDCPVVYHTGPAGNQSPRHVTEGNTFAEAKRLGHMLGRAIAQAIPDITYTPAVSLESFQTFVDLPPRELLPVPEAKAQLDQAVRTLEHLRRTNAPRAETRTAECAWFGAERALALAEANEKGLLSGYYDEVLPAEVQILKIGPWSFVGWPGEIFVEHALAVKAQYEDTFIIELANGPLRGYLVTEEAAQKGCYEAFGTAHSPKAGEVLAETTLQLLHTATG
jgi:hypothetical protein